MQLHMEPLFWYTKHKNKVCLNGCSLCPACMVMYHFWWRDQYQSISKRQEVPAVYFILQLMYAIITVQLYCVQLQKFVYSQWIDATQKRVTQCEITAKKLSTFSSLFQIRHQCTLEPSVRTHHVYEVAPTAWWIAVLLFTVLRRHEHTFTGLSEATLPSVCGFPKSSSVACVYRSQELFGFLSLECPPPTHSQ